MQARWTVLGIRPLCLHFSLPWLHSHSLFLPDYGSLFACSNSLIWPHDLTTQGYSHESCQSQKRCTRVTEGQLLTAGIQELLEPSRALLYIVPNPGSGCDQARDSKGNTNTVLDSGCLSISSTHLFFKKEIKENSLWLSFQLRLIKVLRAKESILLLPHIFLCC